MTLFVPDLDRARQFYQDVFGLDAQPADDDTIVLRFKDMYLFLHKSAAAQEPLPEALDEARKGAGQFAIIVGDVVGGASYSFSLGRASASAWTARSSSGRSFSTVAWRTRWLVSK